MYYANADLNAYVFFTILISFVAVLLFFSVYISNKNQKSEEIKAKAEKRSDEQPSPMNESPPARKQKKQPTEPSLTMDKITEFLDAI